MRKERRGERERVMENERKREGRESLVDEEEFMYYLFRKEIEMRL